MSHLELGAPCLLGTTCRGCSGSVSKSILRRETQQAREIRFLFLPANSRDPMFTLRKDQSSLKFGFDALSRYNHGFIHGATGEGRLLGKLAMPSAWITDIGPGPHQSGDQSLVLVWFLCLPSAKQAFFSCRSVPWKFHGCMAGILSSELLKITCGNEID